MWSVAAVVNDKGKAKAKKDHCGKTEGRRRGEEKKGGEQDAKESREGETLLL